MILLLYLHSYGKKIVKVSCSLTYYFGSSSSQWPCRNTRMAQPSLVAYCSRRSAFKASLRHRHSNGHAEGRETTGDDVQTPAQQFEDLEILYSLQNLQIIANLSTDVNTSFADTAAFFSSMPRLALRFWEEPAGAFQLF